MVGRTALSSVAIVNGILRGTIVLSTARTCTGVTMTILVIQKRPFTEKKRLTFRLTFKQKIKGEIQYINLFHLLERLGRYRCCRPLGSVQG